MRVQTARPQLVLPSAVGEFAIIVSGFHGQGPKSIQRAMAFQLPRSRPRLLALPPDRAYNESVRSWSPLRRLVPPMSLLLVAACTVRPPPAAIAWRDDARTIGPAADRMTPGHGYLKVETGTDLREIGRRTFFNVRRPYDLYSADGKILRIDVDNEGGQFGEVPAIVELPAARYVVASTYGTTYKKIQVRVAPNALTEIPEKAWMDAPAARSAR
jgi:hypothetical protein